jgi:hypothetical protein
MRGGIDPMTTDNGFQPDRPPIFLSERIDETSLVDVERHSDIAAVSSRIFKASALAAAVTMIGVGALSVGNPVALVANMTDWWNDKPPLQLEADASVSTMQAMTDAQDAPATTDAAAREQVAVAAAPADQNQTETAQRPPEPVQVQPVQVQADPPRPAEVAQSQTESSPPVSKELFNQFQAWAAEDEARKRTAATSAASAQDAQPARPVKKQRRAHSVQNARAEVRPQRQHRTRVRAEQETREPLAPAADPRAPDPAAQNAQPPSFFQSLGFR